MGGAESSKSADKETSLNETRKRRSDQSSRCTRSDMSYKNIMTRKDKRVKKERKKITVNVTISGRKYICVRSFHAGA